MALRLRPAPGAGMTVVLLVFAVAMSACGSTVQPATGAAAATSEQGLAGEVAPAADGLGPAGLSSGPPAAESGHEQPGITQSQSAPDRGQPADPLTPDGSGSTAANAAPTTAGSTPVNRSPITIGVLAAGSFAEAAQDAGADAGTSTSGDATMKAMLRYYEKRGGIAGRPLRAVYSSIAPTTNNYETALAAECARFTEDNDVALVLSNIGYYKDSFEACLHSRSKPHIEGGWGLTDEADMGRFPGYYLPNMPSYDARFAALVDSGTASGQLGRGAKVGVVVEDCPQIQRAYAAEWLPRARRAGLVVDEFHVKCTTGAEDAGPLAQAMQSAQLRFRSNGVETVMFATYPTEVNVLFFSRSASAQQWHPKYYLDSKARVAHEHETGNYPRDQVENMQGVGWTPALDVSKPQLTSPSQKRCLAIMRQAGIIVQTGLDAELAFSACDPFFLLEAALTASRGASEPDALQAAIEALGRHFSAAGNGAATAFSARKHYGSSKYATFAFDGGCTCVRYTSRYRTWR